MPGENKPIPIVDTQMITNLRVRKMLRQSCETLRTLTRNWHEEHSRSHLKQTLVGSILDCTWSGSQICFHICGDHAFQTQDVS